jgi:hypothetical protein
MVVRRGFLLTIALCALLVIWWALCSFSVLPAICKATNRLTLYRGPFSSLCLSHYLSKEPVDSKDHLAPQKLRGNFPFDHASLHLNKYFLLAHLPILAIGTNLRYRNLRSVTATNKPTG